MKTLLIFNTEDLIKKINTKEEFFEIKENKNLLEIEKKYKNHKGNNFSTNLPKQIKISPEAVGLIVGEGFISKRHFVFANCNKKAVDIILDFLRQFNLQLKFYLEISVKNKPKEFVRECINFWERHLKFKINKIRLRKEFYNSGNPGTIHISLYNALLAKILNQIIKISKKKIEKNKVLAIGYLKGIIAAEGNINVKKSTGCVYMVRISASKPEEREHYKRCLEKAGIRIFCEDMPTVSPDEGIKRGWKTTKGRAGAVIISKWENFVKILESGLLELYKEKQEKFNKYFLNNKFTNQFLDFKYFIGKEFTMKEAQNHFKFAGRHLDRILSLYKKGYISRRRLNKHKLIYRLTDNYLALYSKLKLILNSPISQ